MGESIYDHPFQWGSKRIGPDLARVGGKYPNLWHFNHMRNPREVSPGSTMPDYPWLYTDKTDVGALPNKISVQRKIGVPYPAMTDESITKDVAAQEQMITADLKAAGAETQPDREIVALISYLQKIGKAELVAQPETKTAKR
jgi:cytochrome c oxidase cbb3-type subunit I/II